MRDDERVSSNFDYTRDSTSDRGSGMMEQPLLFRTRSGEEVRPRSSGSQDALSPAAPDHSSAINGPAAVDPFVSRRESTPSSSSHAFFAPPSTPAPQYGFRRNTANAMTAGRRVSHRSTSLPSTGIDEREGGYDSQLGARDTGQFSSTRASGSSLQDGDFFLNGAALRAGKEARRGGSGGLGGGAATSTAPGTLPSSSGHAFRYNNDLRKYGGERIFQMDDDEVAAALLGEAPQASLDVDRRAGYRYPALGSKTRSSSAPAVATAGGSASPQLLSPSVARLETGSPIPVPEGNGGPAAPTPAEPRPRREKRSGRDEKKRRHHSSKRSRGAASSGASRGAPSETPAQPMAASTSPWFAGMTTAQESRFESLQERSSTGHELARWKMLELMRHWMSAQGTRSSVEAVIRDVLVDAGLAKVKEAWAGNGETGTPGTRVTRSSSSQLASAGATSSPAAEPPPELSAALSASPPTSEAPRDRVSPKNQLIAKTVAASSPADGGEPPHHEGTPDEKAAEHDADATAATGQDAAGDAGPQSAMGTGSVAEEQAVLPTIETESPASPPPTTTSATVAVEVPEKAAHLSGTSHQHHRKREKKSATAAQPSGEGAEVSPSLAAQSPPPPPPPPDGSPGSAQADSEGQSVELATPEKQIAPAAREVVETPPEATTTPPKVDAREERAHAVRPLSEVTTPQRSPSEGPLRSRRSSERALQRIHSANNSFHAAAQSRGATYDEIPRFYFPLGRPSTGEHVINGPLSKKHENPHLKVVDGVAIAAAMYDGEENGHLGANAEALVGSSGEDASHPTEARRGPKVAPMSNLHMVEDRQVAQTIQREFSRLPPYPKHSSKVRLLSGRVRGGAHHNSNLPFAKQELIYKQQYMQCMQRICSQCFGVPRYFAYIILRLIQYEANNGAADPSADGSRPSTRQAMGSRLGSSSSLLSHTTNGSTPTATTATTTTGTLPSLFHVTPQHLRDFYEAKLRNKDSVRRIFDLLILSSRLPNSPVAAASHAVTNAAAAAAKAAEQRADSAVPPSPDTASLRAYLLPQDFVAYIDVLLSQHPGLTFLRQTPDFQTKYLDTVVYRIFYELDRLDRGSIRYSELVASRLVDAFRQVDVAEDINAVLLFFSYEHFYVLYCRFWELDEDRDMLLSPEDLMRYAPEDIMNPAIVDRVFSGAGRRLCCTTPERIGYEDFVWFCLSEEDKSTPQAIRYWFRILDLDSDGVLSVYELREFYDATRNKIAQYVQEGLVTFEDVACQVFDMMRCSEVRGLYLSDLLREPEAAAVALNMLTNVVKFLQFEQRDPFVAHQDRLLGGLEQSAWDRFARVEYDRMALETDEDG